MFKILLLIITIMSANAQDENYYRCNKVFESKRDQLQSMLSKIYDKEEAYQAYKDATMSLIKKKKAYLVKKVQSVDNNLKIITKKENSIKKLIEKNKQILENIQKKVDDKISQSYLKMKDQSAADILSNLTNKEASSILYKLKPKKYQKYYPKWILRKLQKLQRYL
jgi:flagellar motility protein MotE (MotC chaperone)